jgi:hypothetical protein
MVERTVMVSTAVPLFTRRSRGSNATECCESRKWDLVTSEAK